MGIMGEMHRKKVPATSISDLQKLPPRIGLLISPGKTLLQPQYAKLYSLEAREFGYPMLHTILGGCAGDI